MVTSDNLSNAASTLAHHWASRELMDRHGVERVILSYPSDYRPALCVLIAGYLEEREGPLAHRCFLSWLLEIANVSEDA